MSRKLTDLNQTIQQMAKQWLELCAERELDVLVTQTRRSFDEQDKLYAQGRTAPGNIVTNARPGDSYHNYDCAIDFVPMRHGKPVWEASTTEDRRLWYAAGSYAEAVGFEWAGRWTGKLRELCHIQFTAGKTLDQLKAERQKEIHRE